MWIRKCRGIELALADRDCKRRAAGAENQVRAADADLRIDGGRVGERDIYLLHPNEARSVTRVKNGCRE